MRNNSAIISLIQDAQELLLPRNCIYCTKPLREDTLCIYCRILCGRTDHFNVRDNQIIKRLKLRCKLDSAAALYYYTKAGPVQAMIQKLKYNGIYSIGLTEGFYFGQCYTASKHFERADVIIPIPSHWQRRMRRSYNQSSMFARGIKRATGIKINESTLVKTQSTLSQTKKSRHNRIDNIMSSFELRNPKSISGKSILLVDDVLTTGATMEAAVTVLNRAGCRRIQLGLMALAIN